MAVFSLWNMKGYFDTIPVDIEEAARMDGATDLQVVTRIVMPLAKPSVVVTALMVLIYVWNEYIYATTFMTGEENYTLAAGLYALQATEMSGSWPVFAAASIVVSLPVLIIFFLCQKHMTSGLTAGGVRDEPRCDIPPADERVLPRPRRKAYCLPPSLREGDLRRVTLSYGDTACRVTPIIFTTLEMELAASDEYHDYWELCAESEYSRVYYYFTLYGADGEWTYYYGDELTRTLVDERSEYFKLPYNHRATSPSSPTGRATRSSITSSRTASPRRSSPSPARDWSLNTMVKPPAHVSAARSRASQQTPGT